MDGSWLSLQTAIESTVVVETHGYWENITGEIELVECDQCISVEAFMYPYDTPHSGIRYIENFGSEYVRRVMIFCSKHLPPGDVADVPQQFQILNPWGEPEHTNFGHLPAHVRLVTAAYLDRALARHIEAAAKARTDTVCGTKTAEQRSSGESFDFDF